MLFSVLGHGFSSGTVGVATRRLRRVAFHAGRLARRALRQCDRVLRAWGARRLAREMQSWPDERLKDIGLSRAELAGAIEGVRRPFRWVPDHEPAKLDPARFGH